MKMIFCFILVLCVAFTHTYSMSRYNNPRVLRNSSLNEQRKVQTCKFNICEDAPKYPETKVHRIVNQHEAFHSFFNGNVFKTSSNNIMSISSRSVLEGNYLCKTTDVKTAPRLMKDVEDVTRVIVNVENYNQILNFQVCQKEGDKCFEERLLNYETKCQQNYSNIKLVTINVTSSILEYKTFKIPTTCVCTYKRYF